MLEEPVTDDTTIPYDNSSFIMGVEATLCLNEKERLTSPLRDPDDLAATPYDEYTSWVLTAAHKKSQREARRQRQHPAILSTCTSVADEPNSIQTSPAKGDTKEDQPKVEQQQQQQKVRRQRRHTTMGSSGGSGFGDSGVSQKSTTAPTRLPTPKASSTLLASHVERSGSNVALPLPASSNKPKRTRHLSQLDGNMLQRSDPTKWLTNNPPVSTTTTTASKPSAIRRPVSMNSPFVAPKTSPGTKERKSSNRLVDYDPYLSNDSLDRKGTIKCSSNHEGRMTCHTPASGPKTPQRQYTATVTNTRIPLPISRKSDSNTSTEDADPPVSEQHQQKISPPSSSHRSKNEIIRRASLLSSDLLQEQWEKERKQSRCLDVNLVSVQGELCVPDFISQPDVLDQPQSQDDDLLHDQSSSSSSIPSTNRPMHRRISSLHERLQELAYDESAWNEITKPSLNDGSSSSVCSNDGVSGSNMDAKLSAQQQHPHLSPGTMSLEDSDNSSQTLPIPSDSTGTTTSTEAGTIPALPRHSKRPAMSPPTAFKLYQHHLSPFERQEIMKYSQIFFVGQHIKNKYQATLDKPNNNYGYDDERGDYLFVPNDHLAYRYEVLEIMGKGSFGQVVKAFDYRSGCTVAVKLIRNKKRFHAQALVEIKTLEDLIKWDPDDKHNNVRMTDHFYFRNHLCIAFECLSINLYDFIRNNNFQGFSMGLIRRFTIQLLNSLMVLSQHQLIHCDLKPENILLKHPTKSTIKVIDFGSSCLENEKVYTYIQSRFYRAPEVILGLDYTMAIDMWSVGCILAELYTGYPLFPGENEQDQLACIMEVQGVPGRTMVEKSARRKAFFDFYGNPKIIPNSKGKKRKPGTKSLAQTLKCSDAKFVDFIDRCLQWNPQTRVKPEEAFRHGWIARQPQQ